MLTSEEKAKQGRLIHGLTISTIVEGLDGLIDNAANAAAELGDDIVEGASKAGKIATKTLLKTTDKIFEASIQYQRVRRGEVTVIEATIDGLQNIATDALAVGAATEAILLLAAAAVGTPIIGISVVVAGVGAVAIVAVTDAGGQIKKISNTLAAEGWDLLQSQLSDQNPRDLTKIEIIDSDTGRKWEIETDPKRPGEVMQITITEPDREFRSEQVALEFAASIKKFPLPKLKPVISVTVKHSDAEPVEEFDVIDGDADKVIGQITGGRGTLNSAGVMQLTTDPDHPLTVIPKDATVTLDHPEHGQMVLPATRFFKMVGDEVDAFADFVDDMIQAATQKVLNTDNEDTLQKTSALTQQLIGRIIAGVLQGRDIETITAEFATQVVASKAVDRLTAELGFTTQMSSSLAVETTQDALTAIAVTAILQGRDAGLKEYAQAAATASVRSVVRKGVDNFFKSSGAKEILGGSGSRIGGAGVEAAIVAIAASVIAGDLDDDAFRGAATAAAIAATAHAMVVFMELGSVGGPVGIIIGAALGLTIGNLFPSGGERIYHNESIGYVTQAKPDGTGDVIIGIRETGALLRAGTGMDDILGTAADDVLVGNDMKNVLIGDSGDDMLEARGHDDVVLAGAGDDYVEAGEGNDYVEGNAGRDKIYGNNGNDSLLGGDGDDIIAGGAGNDNIEAQAGDDLVTGDAGDDVILGGSGHDTLHGGAGRDLINAGTGNDIIDGGAGNDELHGGEGDDTLLGDHGNDVLKGGNGNDVMYGDEGIDILYGGPGKDILVGGDEADLLYGGLDNDILFGEDGNDHLHGQLGDDHLVGGLGNDSLLGGDGNDVYAMGRGDGQDTISDIGGSLDILWLANYAVSEITFKQTNGNLVLSAAPNGLDQVTILNQITQPAIELVVFADGRAIELPSMLFYNGSTTALHTQISFPGTWQQAAADRSFQHFNPSSSWYYVNFDSSTINSAIDTELYNDVQVRETRIKSRSWYGRTRLTIHYYDYIETSLVGTHLSDRIVGLSLPENIQGLSGNDQLYGNSGADTLDGGDGHDLLLGGSQGDTILGGNGNDKAFGGVGSDLMQGGSGNDAMLGEWDPDTLQGGDGDDMLNGGAGDDTVSGGPGHDIIYGEQGDDRLFGNAGNDFILAGVGNDYVDGGTGQDHLEGGEGNDTLVGGEGDDTLRGDDGDDSLAGNAGNDLLIGGQGADTLNGGANEDTVSYAQSNAAVQVNLQTSVSSGGYATGDQVIDVENVVGSDYDDTLHGNAAANKLEGGYGNDSLYGGNGDDELQGGAGADYLNGGQGWDKVSYADSPSGVIIDLAAGTGRNGYADGDVFVEMEHVVGSRFDDCFIIGNTSATFDAGAGYDTVELLGDAKHYEIILDRNTITARHKTTTSYYTFPNVERLRFNDVSYGLADFPGDGDAVAVVLMDDSVQGIISLNGTYYQIQPEITAQQGFLQLYADASYHYQPMSGFVGSDQFTLRITDPTTQLVRLQHVDVQVNINDRTPQTRIDSLANLPDESNVIRLSDGSYVSCWQQRIWRPDTPTSIEGERETQILLQRYDTRLTKIGTPILITSATGRVGASGFSGDSVSDPKLTELPNGNLAFAWKRNSVMQTIVTTNNGTTVNAVAALVAPAQGAFYSDIITMAEGGYAIAYSNSLPAQNTIGIFVDAFDALGTRLFHYALSDTVAYDYPKLQQMSNGDLLLTWLSGNTKFSFAGKILYANGGQSELLSIPQNGRSVLNNNPRYDVMLLNDQLFAVAFVSPQQSTYEAVVQLFKITGELLAEQLLFTPGSGNGAQGTKLRLAPNANDDFMVSWSQGEAKSIEAQQFDYDLKRLGTSLTVTDPSENNHRLMVVNTLAPNQIQFIFNDPNAGEVIARTVSLLSNLRGSSGNDVLQGDNQANVLIGLSGADLLDGGDDIDTVSYQDSDAAVSVDLATIGYTDMRGRNYTVGSGGHAEGDRLRLVENLIGSIYDDHFIPGPGSNHIDGSNGNDTVSLLTDLSDQRIVLHDGVVTISPRIASVPHPGNDTFTQIEWFQFNDVLIGEHDFPRVDDSRIRVLANGRAQGVLGNPAERNFQLGQAAENGTVVLHANGTYTYRPNTDYLGPDFFRYIAINQQGLGTTVDVNVNVANDIAIEAKTLTSFCANEATDGSQSDPNVIQLSDQRLLVTWGKSGTKNHDGVFGRITDHDGVALSRDFKIDFLNVSAGGAHETSAVALADGGFVVFWDGVVPPYTDSSSTGIFGLRFDREGHPVGDFFQVNTEFSGEQRHPQAVLLSSGRIAVIWTDQLSSNVYTTFAIRGQVINPDGSHHNSEINIDEGRVSERPRVMALKAGGFQVLWDKYSADASGFGVFKKVFNNDGLFVVDKELVNTATFGDQRVPTAVATDNNGYAIAWFDLQSLADQNGTQDGSNGRIRVQQYDAQHQKVGQEKTINANPITLSAKTLDERLYQNLEVTQTENRTYYFTWSVANTVYGQLVDDQFARMREQDVLFVATGNIDIHSATSLGNGLLAVAFQDRDETNDVNNIRTQIIKVGYPILYGTLGNDVLQSGDGDDVLDGASGNDVYTTGLGRDRIIIGVSANSQDVITDFDPAQDQIDLTAYDFLLNGYSDLQNRMQALGTDTLINLDNDHTLLIRNHLPVALPRMVFIGSASGNSIPIVDLWHGQVSPNSTFSVNVLDHASDLDGEVLRLQSVTQASNGTISFDNSTLVYTPDVGFIGDDSVDYVVTDEQGGEYTHSLIFSVRTPAPPTPTVVQLNATVIADLLRSEVDRTEVSQPITATVTAAAPQATSSSLITSRHSFFSTQANNNPNDAQATDQNDQRMMYYLGLGIGIPFVISILLAVTALCRWEWKRKHLNRASETSMIALPPAMPGEADQTDFGSSLPAFVAP